MTEKLRWLDLPRFVQEFEGSKYGPSGGSKKCNEPKDARVSSRESDSLQPE